MTDGGEQPWTVYDASQYLPAVLSDPNKGKQLNFFTRTWGDSFVEKTEIHKSPFLPEVTYAHFEQYLKKYGRRSRRHLQLKQLRLEGRVKASENGPQEDKLGLIPGIYMQSEFRLNDPKVFSQVFDLDATKTDHDLQDELSLYLDIVEEQIAKQVSQKSGAFFHAMTSHDTILEQMGQASAEVGMLRFKVQKVDKCLTCDPLKLLAHSRSKNNHKQLLYKLKLMSTVLQTQPTLQLLLSSSDYVGALEMISSTQEVLAKELAGVTSLRHLPSQLKEMSKLIDKMLSTEFERYVAADLHRPFTSNDTGVLEQERLISLAAGLLRQNNLRFFEIYKQEAITASQAVMKQLMIEQLANAEDELNELTGLGEVAPPMDSANWLNVLRLGSKALGKIMRRVKSVHDVIKDVADVSIGQLPNSNQSGSNVDRFISLDEYNQVIDKLRLLLTSVCDYCNERLATLVSQQSEKSLITAAQVADLAKTVDEFTNLCQEICGKPSTTLQVAFKIQANNYVHKFHQQRKSKLTFLLEAETWKSAQVPPEIQSLVDRLALGQPLTSLPAASPCRDEENSATPTLRAGSQHYVTIGTVLILIRLVAEYCVCAHDLKLVATLIARNLTELLRTFNTGACQLVLGAKALRTAGLKTITSTNLALASRSLQLLLWLIPLVRAIFKRLSSQEENLGALDTVEKDIGNHVHQLEAKVLSIMNNMLSEELGEWEAKPPVPSKQFRNVSRQLTKLHEAVSAVLPEEQISDIYQEIHKNFKTRIREQIIRMNVQNNGGPRHGLVTTEIIFYLQTMKMLRVLPAKFLGDHAMDDIWDR